MQHTKRDRSYIYCSQIHINYTEQVSHTEIQFALYISCIITSLDDKCLWWNFRTKISYDSRVVNFEVECKIAVNNVNTARYLPFHGLLSLKKKAIGSVETEKYLLVNTSIKHNYLTFTFCWPCIMLWFLVNEKRDAKSFTMYLFF